MNEINIFSHQHFGEIRTAGTKDNPLFCLSDICRVLELDQPSRVKSRLKEGGVTQIKVGVSTGTRKDGTPSVQQVDMTFINEQNLYKVIMRSDKPQAESFQDWVCGEVLPSIRKHGAYATDATIESIIADPDNGIRLLNALKEEREQRRLAESKASLLEEVTREQAPKVIFADAIIGSKSSCLIGELAKIITQNGHAIGQNRLFAWMRENGYLGSKGEHYNIPKQKYLEQELFELKKSVHSENGVMKTTVTTKVTQKGCSYFINKFLTA